MVARTVVVVVGIGGCESEIHQATSFVFLKCSQSKQEGLKLFLQPIITVYH